MLGRFLRRRCRPSMASLRAPKLRRRFAVESLEARTLLAGSEIAVLDGAAEIVSGNTIPIDFGIVAQGATRPTRTFTIRNDGDDSLTLGSVNLPAGFSLADGLFPSIAVRGSDTFTVRLDSAALGIKSGQISISNNDDDENPFTIALFGTVLNTAPEISVLRGSAIIADSGLTPFEFGVGLQRETGPRQSFTVRNDGTSTLTLGTVALPTGFTLFEGLTSSLAPKASDSFTVRLDTMVIGTFTGEITFANNDADESPFNFTVTATVTPQAVPEITILDVDTPLSSGSATVIDFGIAVRRQTAPTRTFTIRNDGDETLSLGRIDLPAGFSLLKGHRRNLAPRGTDTIIVRLDTKRAGVKTGQLVIESNDSDEPAFRIAIMGNVLA